MMRHHYEVFLGDEFLVANDKLDYITTWCIDEAKRRGLEVGRFTVRMMRHGSKVS